MCELSRNTNLNNAFFGECKKIELLSTYQLKGLDIIKKQKVVIQDSGLVCIDHLINNKLQKQEVIQLPDCALQYIFLQFEKCFANYYEDNTGEEWKLILHNERGDVFTYQGAYFEDIIVENIDLSCLLREQLQNHLLWAFDYLYPQDIQKIRIRCFDNEDEQIITYNLRHKRIEFQESKDGAIQCIDDKAVLYPMVELLEIIDSQDVIHEPACTIMHCCIDMQYHNRVERICTRYGDYFALNAFKALSTIIEQTKRKHKELQRMVIPQMLMELEKSLHVLYYDVVFEPKGKNYCYLYEGDDVQVDDFVVVTAGRNDTLQVTKVVGITEYIIFDVPYSYRKMKSIIQKLSPTLELLDYWEDKKYLLGKE